jgi:hypothetical protein
MIFISSVSSQSIKQQDTVKQDTLKKEQVKLTDKEQKWMVHIQRQQKVQQDMDKLLKQTMVMDSLIGKIDTTKIKK